MDPFDQTKGVGLGVGISNNSIDIGIGVVLRERRHVVRGRRRSGRGGTEAQLSFAAGDSFSHAALLVSLGFHFDSIY